MTPQELRAWRLAHDLTQRELAWALGYSVSTIERWEAAKVPVPTWWGNNKLSKQEIRRAKRHTERNAIRKRLGPRRS